MFYRQDSRLHKLVSVAVAAICVGDWGTSAEGASASVASARIETPKAPRKVGCEEKVSPPHF